MHGLITGSHPALTGAAAPRELILPNPNPNPRRGPCTSLTLTAPPYLWDVGVLASVTDHQPPSWSQDAAQHPWDYYHSLCW